MNIIEQRAELVAMTPNPIFVIEKCGRICYKSEDKTICGDPECWESQKCNKCVERAEKFVNGIIVRGHESVLEHASATFHLITDRGISHEIVRHRLASYSQESTRYCNYGKSDISVILPNLHNDDLSKNPANLVYWEEAINMSEDVYIRMIENGIKPEHARSVLPTCLKTEIIVTANFRQWKHMFDLRLKETTGRAHPQIKVLFKMILDEFMKTQASLVFKEYEI